MKELFNQVARFNRAAKTSVTMPDLTGEGRPTRVTVNGETNADVHRTEQLLRAMDKVTFSRKRLEGQDKDIAGNTHGAPRAQFLGIIAAEHYVGNNEDAIALKEAGCSTIGEYEAKLAANEPKAEEPKPTKGNGKKTRKGKVQPELHTVELPAETPAEASVS